MMKGNAPPCVRVMELARNIPRSAVNEPVQQHQFPFGNGTTTAWSCGRVLQRTHTSITGENRPRGIVEGCTGKVRWKDLATPWTRKQR